MTLTQASPRQLIGPMLASFVLVVAVQSLGLGQAPMSGTEGFRALAAHQMVESGDWLLPRLYGELYLRKPPMHYWITACLESITGQANEWIWRLPSVLMAGLTASLVALFAGRWFGVSAAWCSGLSFLSLITLWAQTRSADIDSSHTFFSLAATLCLLEVGFGKSARRWPWALLGGAALAGSLLVKGHAGLIVVGGALIGASIATRQGRWLRRSACWGQLLLGLALAGAWVGAAYVQVNRLGLPADLSGVDEAGVNVLDASRVFFAIVTPLQLLAMGAPLSVVLLAPGLWKKDPSLLASPIVRALIGSIGGAFIIMILNGVTNPRYGYVLLPLLCPLFGAAVQAWRHGQVSSETAKIARMIATGLCIGLPITHAVLMFSVLNDSDGLNWPVLILSVGLAILAVVFWIRQRVAIGSVLLLLLLICFTVPVNGIKAQQRTARSAANAAGVINEVVPAGQPLLAGLMLRDKPDVFLYADRQVIARYHQHLNMYTRRTPELPAGSGWAVFNKREWAVWRDAMPERFDEPIELPVTGWLVRYHDVNDGTR